MVAAPKMRSGEPSYCPRYQSVGEQNLRSPMVASFAIAVALALWMRSSGYGWAATLGVAAIVWVVLPFVISQPCAAVVLGAHPRANAASRWAYG